MDKATDTSPHEGQGQMPSRELYRDEALEKVRGYFAEGYIGPAAADHEHEANASHRIAESFFAILDMIGDLRRDIHRLRDTVDRQGARIRRHTHDMHGDAVEPMPEYETASDAASRLGYGPMRQDPDKQPAPQGWQRLVG